MALAHLTINLDAFTGDDRPPVSSYSTITLDPGADHIDAAADVIHVRTIVVSLDRQTPRDHRMPGHVVGVLRHQLPRRFDHRVDVDRRHRLNPDSASRDHVRATHRHVDHHQVT